MKRNQEPGMGVVNQWHTCPQVVIESYYNESRITGRYFGRVCWYWRGLRFMVKSEGVTAYLLSASQNSFDCLFHNDDCLLYTLSYLMNSLLCDLWYRFIFVIFQEKALSVFHHWSSTLPTGQPIDMYKEFKILGMNLTLRIFLDIDPEISSKLAEDILALSITHWHGKK